LVHEAISKGVNATAVPADDKPGPEPPPFRVLPAFWSLPLVSFLGVTAIAGLWRFKD
jgi:hypothetical protein